MLPERGFMFLVILWTVVMMLPESVSVFRIIKSSCFGVDKRGSFLFFYHRSLCSCLQKLLLCLELLKTTFLVMTENGREGVSCLCSL